MTATLNQYRARASKRFHLAKAFSSPVIHEAMILDRARCEGYRDALARVVRPGDVVVDLGAGTGLLSFFAVRAGARHVFAIEMSEIGSVAQQLIDSNNLRDRVTLMRAHSQHVRLPERCDVLVTETLSSFGFDNENIIESIADARARMLKPDGRVLPESCDTFLVPIQSDEFGLGHTSRFLYGLDYSAFWAWRFQRPFGLHISGMKFVELAAPQRGWHMEFRETPEIPRGISLSFMAVRDGRLDGFVGWFDAALCPGVSITNAPGASTTSWPQVYFPVLDQPSVRAGQRLRLDISPNLSPSGVRWEYLVSIQ